MHKVRVKSCRHFLEHPVGIEVAEVLLPTRISHNLFDLFVVCLNLYAQRLEQVSRRIPNTSGEHAAARLEMNIVSASERFFAAFNGWEDSKPLFIRTFVRGEAHITIDAPNTIFRLQTCQRRINLLCQTSNILRREIYKRLMRSFILFLMRHKPLTVIMTRQLRKEIKDICYFVIFHVIIYFINTYPR